VDFDGRRLHENDIRGAPPKGTRLLTAALPGGRVVRLAVPAPVATDATVRNLARLAENVSEQHVSTAFRQREGIVELSHRVANDTSRLSAAMTARTAGHRRHLRARYARLDRRVTEAAADYRGRIQRQVAFDEEAMRRLRRRDLWDKIVVASSLPLFAAYGQQGQPFNTTNVALTLSLLIWLVGDQVVAALFGSDEKEEKPEYPWRDTDIWSYIAPIGNVLTGWWLFGDRQTERFVSGVTTVKVPVDATAPAPQVVFHHSETVELSKRIAKDDRDDFKSFKRMPVVATFGSSRLSAGATVQGLDASVSGGRLTLSFSVVTPAPVAERPASLGEVDIAWIVDTAKPTNDT
jgi:hypothetical protein